MSKGGRSLHDENKIIESKNNKTQVAGKVTVGGHLEQKCEDRVHLWQTSNTH
jgi:hypothetical protein